jgi:hypothetical protein
MRYKMYVEDMSLAEAWEWEELLQRKLAYRMIGGGGRSAEQLQWDLEDIHAHIQALDPLEGTQ